MSNRAFVLGAVFRVLLISAAFFVGFSLEGHAQTPGAPEGRLTSTDGKMTFPFFQGSKVGDVCNPYVDYNCEISEAALKAARDAAEKRGKCDPYLDYKCLDTYLGEDVATRFFRYYQLEWGKAAAPADPAAPPSARDAAVWPKSPVGTPPMPFVDFPYGGAPAIGTTRPNSVDSPFMAAIANTGLGKWMQDAHIQIYGWVDGGFNLSTNQTQPGGNSPVGYTYTPNTIQLDQAVVYIERLPDTVQKDHIDWGFRLSALYGENYRYTNSYGLLSDQFNGRNQINGFDFPMVYGDIYIPYVAEGLNIRFGRYISVPDIEAQLAPNNYTYTHSLTYTYDNYTNTGILTTLALTKNWMVQLGVDTGTETPLWNHGVQIPNPMPNALYPGNTMPKDPGNQISFAACIRWTSDSGNDTFYPCVDGINDGAWGYNNLQWHGFTYYHKFNEYWHLSFEAYWISENGVPNLRNPNAQAIFAGGGTPFSPQYVAFNPPNQAYCPDINALSCTANAYGVLAYLNYSPDKLNNFSFRPEIYDDPQGWRTGTGNPVRYYAATLGWQHFFSPQFEIRPEVSFWHAEGYPAFNAGTKNDMFMLAMDAIVHF
ncbi:MAG TPA: outer membrane beta-barrel protein [Reyranella sp.]|nr:outer membrane beta-barrel protein [Reyranella sp.]